MSAKHRLLFSSLALVAAMLVGCAPSDQETDYRARKALLQRQNRGIRELIAEAETSSIVPANRFLLGVDESIVQSVLRSELPVERPLGKRFHIRLESASVQFRDKFGVIILDGVVFRPQTPERITQVRVHGGLGAVSIDSTTDQLTIKIAIDEIEILKAGILENVLGNRGKKLLATKGRELLQDKLPVLHVPVALAQKIRVPAVTSGALQLDSLVVPLNLSVQRVLAARQKLWVTLHADVGTITGGQEGLGVRVGKKKKGKS
jgi:hypothetical protein